MKSGLYTETTAKEISTNKNRSRLLNRIPVTENRFMAAGLPTVVLEGGEGRPVILLHGPGESSLWWMRVIPDLVKTHHVIVPDLPGHAATGADIKKLDEQFVSQWLGEVINTTCSSTPVLVGNILGGSIAARYAVKHGDQLGKLVLVNSLGLAKFRPSIGFAFGLIRFMIRSSEKNFTRFLRHYCMYDVRELKSGMGEDWEPFVNYVLECANNPAQKKALRQ